MSGAICGNASSLSTATVVPGCRFAHPGYRFFGLRFADLRLRVSLRVEQRREIAMVDARAGRGGDDGLRVIRDAEPCVRNHQQVVGAVAQDQGFFFFETERGTQFDERRELGVASEYRRLHAAGEAAAA